MNDETKLIIEVWDMMRDALPAARRSDAAIQVIRLFEEYGFDPGDMRDLVGEDPYLGRAYASLYDEDEEEDDEEY